MCLCLEDCRLRRAPLSHSLLYSNCRSNGRCIRSSRHAHFGNSSVVESYCYFPLGILPLEALASGSCLLLSPFSPVWVSERPLLVVREAIRYHNQLRAAVVSLHHRGTGCRIMDRSLARSPWACGCDLRLTAVICVSCQVVVRCNPTNSLPPSPLSKQKAIPWLRTTVTKKVVAGCNATKAEVLEQLCRTDQDGSISRRIIMRMTANL